MAKRPVEHIPDPDVELRTLCGKTWHAARGQGTWDASGCWVEGDLTDADVDDRGCPACAAEAKRRDPG